VARDEGRLAFGSTVFGHRSILADPSDPRTRERLGVLLKEPTGCRPTAATLTLEQAALWFNLPSGIQPTGSIMAVPAKPLALEGLAAVIQEDGTARIQVIDRRDHPELHRTLVELGKLTGREVALTTSFNIAEQPLVNSPRQALEVLLETGIEYLVLDDALIQNKRAAQPLVEGPKTLSNPANVATRAQRSDLTYSQAIESHPTRRSRIM
jgi:carbamoyltransferase